MEEWETLSVEQRQAIDAPEQMGAWGDWVAKAQTEQDKVTIGRGFREREAFIVRAHGHHYLAKPKRSKSDKSLLGFGGTEWKIRFLDGTEIETNDLWYQGEIPLVLRRVLPDNAEFIGSSRGFDAAPHGERVASAMDAEVKELSRYEHNYRRIMRFVEDRQLSDDEYESETDERRPEVPIQDAHVIGSRITEGPRAGLHTLIIDVDHPVRAPRSTNWTHHHLYIDYPMPWDDVVKVLTVLAEVGLVEPGYAAACIDRGETNVRLPWVRKGEEYEQTVYFTDQTGKRVRQGIDPGSEPLPFEEGWPF